MNEIPITKSWIAHEIKNDSELQSLIGDEFYSSVAEVGAADFYIIFRYVSDSATKRLGQRRKLNRLLFDIKVYRRSGGNADFNRAVNRIDEMFSSFKNRTFQGWNFSSEEERMLDLPETDKEKDETTAVTGATYRISAYKL